MPHINDAGLALIESFEGDELRAYPDPGTGGAPWTIGYGHTANVQPGESITEAQAIAFLRSDVAIAEDSVAELVEVTLTPNQFSALVSFEYNTGALAGSSLLGCLNAGDFEGAANQFDRWVYAGGIVLPGLVRRRAAEKALFLTP
jgi:GH24 family phage-related lysozyme (muramidase)